MQICKCGHSIGVHYHTNNLASCAKCGPKCSKFEQCTSEQLATNIDAQLARKRKWLESKNLPSEKV